MRAKHKEGSHTTLNIKNILKGSIALAEELLRELKYFLK